MDHKTIKWMAIGAGLLLVLRSAEAQRKATAATQAEQAAIVNGGNFIADMWTRLAGADLTTSHASNVSGGPIQQVTQTDLYGLGGYTPGIIYPN